MSTVSIVANGLSKEFNRRPVFREISFSLNSPSSLAITGKNGAGKSTLVKIVAGILSSTRGALTYAIDGKAIPLEQFKHTIGFVSPYLNLYDEFTALENLSILSRIRSRKSHNEQYLKELLENLALWHRRNDFVGTYSSGMKQRMKYAFALLHQPTALILDEPTSNLDADGIENVQHIVEEQKRKGILIIATNNAEEASWCQQDIRLGT